MIRTTALALTALAVFPLAALAQAQQKPLTVEMIYGSKPLMGRAPAGLTWSPDGKHLTYLDSGELQDLDVSTGKAHVLVSREKMASLSGNNASETDRDHRSRYNMASYLWAPDSAHLLFDSNGSLWLYDLRTNTGVNIGSAGTASGDDPKFSPDGASVALVREHGLSVISLRAAGTPRTDVAPAPNANTLNGEVDWAYAEELGARSNYFWSPDSKHIAYLQTNEEKVPQYPLTDWIPTHPTVTMQRYPQPGDPNPDVRIGIVGAAGGKTTWIKVPMTAGADYIPRFGWVDAKTVWVEVLTRDHKHRNLYFADIASGNSRTALELNDDKFFAEDAYNVWVEDGSILFTNWSDGHSHLYLYRYDKNNPTTATLERQLTQGDFEVADVLRVDIKNRIVDFASTEGNPLQQQLWQVDFSGQRKQLTTTDGSHSGNFAPTGDAFIDRWSTLTDTPTLSICQHAGNCNVFWSTRAMESFHLRAPEILKVKAKDGTTLYASLLMPEGATTAASVPLIVNPYGGPGPQSVANRWGSDAYLFDVLLTQHGFAVLHADNRGGGVRGRDFAQAAYRNFGPVQLEDQLAVVDAALAQYPQLDGKRLGWWGWSWGGTFTLYTLSHSDRFRAGVSVAPVTDWRNYDSIYTERYMGLPSEYAKNYQEFSVVNSAANLKGHLLLVHGTGDDNVHMQNSVQYVQKLIEAELPYDLQLYPRKTHSIAGADVRTHLFNRILAHFDQYLK